MPTIDSTLRSTAARVPHREALIFGDTRYCYADLDRMVDQVAGELSDRGLHKGDRIAMLSGNSDRFVIAYYAAHRLGAVFVPVNPASTPSELLYVLGDSGPSFLVFDPALTDTVDRAMAAGYFPDALQILGLGPSEAHIDLMALSAQRVPTPLDAAVGEHDDAQIIYTSGTTGEPKGALFDHYRAIWTAVSVGATYGVRDGERILHAAPLYHCAQLCVCLIPGTLYGATHVILPRFDAVAALDALEQERITLFLGVPTMYQLMVRQTDLAERDLSSWRIGLFGAAPMAPSAVEELLTAIPGPDFLQLCGQTEGGPTGIYLTAEQVRARPDANGRQAVINAQCRVVDRDGNDVKPGQAGELILRGPTIMKGYWNRPQATEETVVDGWLHTGDVCYLDDDGYMTLVDRLKDLIISGGRNVYSIEVEGVLAAHPDVVEVAVVGRPHSDYGETVVAVASMREGSSLTLEELRQFACNHISAYKLPRDLVILSELPRNASGKVLKRKLREIVGAKTANSTRVTVG
jgi:acyl-CoA synthetase (AMP-forming)/AMP-acid ligase II